MKHHISAGMWKSKQEVSEDLNPRSNQWYMPWAGEGYRRWSGRRQGMACSKHLRPIPGNPQGGSSIHIAHSLASITQEGHTLTKKFPGSGPKWRGKRHLAIMVFSLLSLAIPVHVFAVLGGSEASVQTDRVHMQAGLRSTSAAGYTVHELHAPTGIVIREFVSGGTVFGVAWEGPWPPDLQQLLGSYFEPYRQAREQQAQSGPAGRRPVHVELPGLVVNISGHPRSFRGQAFVPELVPQGVKAEGLR